MLVLVYDQKTILLRSKIVNISNHYAGMGMALIDYKYVL